MWQRRHGADVYVPVEGARPGHNLHDTMVPLGATPAQMLDTKVHGYTYADDDHVDLQFARYIAAGGTSKPPVFAGLKK
jgi:hypothetical protein